MKHTRIGPRRVRSERPWPGALSASPRDPEIAQARAPARSSKAREMMARAIRRVCVAARTVIRAVRVANHEQVCMWECLLVISGVAPLTAAGPLRWVPSLDGYRLVGSHLPAQNPSEAG